MRRKVITAAAKVVAAILILTGILAAASEGCIVVNIAGLVVMAAGFWMGKNF